ncbi:60S ribosomal protein L22-like [Melanaphis sacchari]|uniref:Large ribosomal subunit protein eL22 n=2 Tax=Melanaphis sacchari TaxID=742174 RepID=A0A2H8TL89_9HEMI|nr:60S ribosomal protein L22-like [Melanaphis sacchari]XP_025206267.1 60S ribosomal protein L22-like [Melanaphis sacchari]XP_025206268.1 60S ribosomal protein L22-like [Melanaphis sacchari]XP_025206269.1 60S ribosomal protein L22-like [Melanaphis sacchari]XP_025206270.1 60S ribosomal protein L22-like [Melanaphis sacchari]
MDPAAKQIEVAGGEKNPVAEMPTTSTLQATSSNNSLKKKKRKIILDCTEPVNISILNLKHFKTFIGLKMRYNDETENSEDVISVKRTNTKIIIFSDVPFTKRYLRFLMKSYFKKWEIAKLWKLVEIGPDSYAFRLLNLVTIKDIESKINEIYSDVNSNSE